MTRAFIFPGQGTQVVGMGKEIAKAFPAAKHVFEEVDEALKQKLSKLIFEGPEEELLLTENAQPAVMAVSMALIRILQSEASFNVVTDCKFVAGHSLGEYSALTAVRAIELQDTARVLKARGRAMQEAVPQGVGAMAALIGIDLELAKEIASEAAKGEVCVAANDNAPGQIVLSGHVGAVERAVEIGKKKGAKRSILLAVSAPFHCSLMAPAADIMAGVLGKVQLNVPKIPIVANVTAAPEKEPLDIRRLLVEQITSPVRWRESIKKMKQLGVGTFVEVGVGKVLTGMVKRIDRELKSLSIQSAEDIDEFLNST
ncbi:ACP S-malonyltransferase [Rhodospirillales bacterium]|nr:ACP S-malonyltransferase [Rhodospirillales bacterium]